MTAPVTHRSDFKVTKTQCHGFPENPSCLAYDSIQKLLAIGSYNGEVLIIGRPGLETRFEIPSGTAIHLMQFCINKGLMLVYCSDSKCYLWSIRTNIPQLLFQIQLPSKDKLTVLYWPYNSSTAYAGTDKGNIYFIYVDLQEHHQSCNISAQLYWCEEIVYWNKVVISSKGFHRDHPGEVVSIEEHPLEPEKILVAYSLGLCIVWNLKNKEVEYRHQHDSIECAYWYGGGGKEYTIAYTSGKITGTTLKKYNEKDTETVKKNDEKILYECPEKGTVNRLQCYNIKKWKWLVFILSAVSGSKIENRVMISGKKGLVTDLLIDQSVIDCMCISTSPFKAERQHPKALVVLQENKLEVFDIQSDPVPLRPLLFCNPFSFGYMSSPITFLHHGGSCFSQTIVDCLMVLKAKFCHQNRNEQTSSQPWPFDGEQTWNPSVKKECLPEIIVTSHADQRGSIKLWLCYPDILEYLFCIDTAELFPVSYRTSEAISLEPVSLSQTESGDSKSDESKESEEDVKQKPCPNGGATLSSDGVKEESDVKFVNINMEQQTIVFVNRRGNVLVFKLCLQPPHESPESNEILLNSTEEVDGISQTSQDNEAVLGWRFWYGHPSEDTLRVHLLYHTYCVVQWEASMRVVSVEAAVYNDAIKMLSLGTHIAVVLVDTQCNGTIIIDTLKTLKSLGMSSISSCETRTVVESKPRKFNLVSKVKNIGKNKEVRMSHPISNDVHPCYSSAVDVVFFALDRNQPSRTLWIGTNSGELAIFHITRQSTDTNHLQLKPTEITIQQKHSIANLIFLTKEFEKIHSCSLWVSRIPENGDTQDDDMILNYVVVQTKKTLECFGFPNKRTVPIGKYKMDTNKDEILRTTFINCKGQPCLLSILSQGELLFSSLPHLHSLTKISEPSLMKKSVLDTLNFVESGEGIYVSLPTKLQRLLVSKGSVEETDSPVSVDCNPQSYVPHHGPVAAGIKIGFKNTTTLHGSIDRDAWFTPHKSVVTTRHLAHNRTSSTETDGSRNELDQNNPFQRTALALNERGDKLNEVVETTRNLAEAAELYEEYVEKRLKGKK